MSELCTLLSLELRSLYGINRFLHTKDLKAKKRRRRMVIVWALLILMAFFYVGALVCGLCALGLSEIVPAYLVMLSSLLILFFGLFTAGNRIFGHRGYDILASMPLKTCRIVLSRFLALYVGELGFSLLILLPGIGVYAYCVRPEFWFYPIALVGVLFVPAIPLVISILFGTLVLAVSSRMKGKSMVQTALSVLLVVGIMVISFSIDGVASGFTAEKLADLAQTVKEVFGSVYPPALWFNAAMVDFDLLHLSQFVLLSAVVIAFAVFLAARLFHSVIRRLRSFTAKHNYRLGALGSRSLLKTLYVREAKRYFSSSIYVTNTIMGPILAAIMSVALCIIGPGAVQSTLPVTVDIVGLLPFVLSAVLCMMPATATAISMEGREVWVVKSLPIPTKKLLDSKMLLNLTLMLPFYIVSVIAMAIAAEPDVLQLVWLILLPASIAVFSVVLGITVNLKSHRFDWDKEETVVKQSLSAALGGFAPVILCLFLGVGVFLLPPQYGDMAKAAACLLLLLGTVLLRKWNNQKQLVDL